MAVSTLEATLVLPEKTLPETKISGERATYKANNYLTKYVSVSFGTEDPVFLPLERPTWQVQVYFKLPRMEPLPLAFLDVDAETGEVTPFTDEQIDTYLYRANAYAQLHASSSTRPV
ncbi:MAG: hypothetical protein AAF702_47070 [Chloroflexota bacterium]